MKKVLFATTALVLTAGVASAGDLSMSGYARFGASYTEGATDESRIESRLRITVTASQETDSGLSLYASTRLQADDGAAMTTNGAKFGVKANGFSLEAGNIAGAIESMPNYYGAAEPGFTGIMGHYSGFGGSIDAYSSTGAGANGVRLAFASGPVSAVASYSDASDAGDRAAVSVAYSANGFTGAVGFQSDDDDDITIATLGGKLGNADVTAFYSDEDAANNQSFGVSAAVAMGVATLQLAASTSDTEGDAYGVGVNYDLGGATLGAAVASVDDVAKAEVGVSFSF